MEFPTARDYSSGAKSADGVEGIEMIRVEGLTFQYDVKDEPVLDQISVDIESGAYPPRGMCGLKG